MPSHIFNKVNKMGFADSNLTIKFLARHKAEYVFDEDDNYDVDKGGDKKWHGSKFSLNSDEHSSPRV